MVPGRERVFTVLVTFTIAAASGHIMQLGMFDSLNQKTSKIAFQEFEPLPVRMDSRLNPATR